MDRIFQMLHKFKIRVLPPQPEKKSHPKRDGFFLFLFTAAGLEPISMQVSDGHLLAPVQKLVPTSIFLSRQGKQKCKSSPASAQ